MLKNIISLGLLLVFVFATRESFGREADQAFQVQSKAGQTSPINDEGPGGKK